MASLWYTLQQQRGVSNHQASRTSLGPDPKVFAQSWLLVHSLDKGLALTKSLGRMSCVYMLADSLAFPIKGCHQFIFQV